MDVCVCIYLITLFHARHQVSEKAMEPHSSTLVWKTPEEPGGLQSMGSLRVRHD